MLISLIVAMDRRGLIGTETGLPWHLPRDLRRFRELTWGKPIVMGRTTHAMIGKPLPGRQNIVLSKQINYHRPGCQVAHTLREALSLAQDYLAQFGGNEVMIIGGGKVYAEAMELWDRLYLTIVDGEFTGDTYFPVHDLLRQNWKPVGEPETHQADEKNGHTHSFHIIERIRDATERAAPMDDSCREIDIAALFRRAP